VRHIEDENDDNEVNDTRILDTLEYDEHPTYHQLPWIPNRVYRANTARCAMCNGEVSPDIIGETEYGEYVHRCMDCGEKHRSVPKPKIRLRPQSRIKSSRFV
jgi:hypothetical protein